MQKGSCEKFLKLPQNHRFDEFSIFMNFIRGATPTLVKSGESLDNVEFSAVALLVTH